MILYAFCCYPPIVKLHAPSWRRTFCPKIAMAVVEACITRAIEARDCECTNTLAHKRPSAPPARNPQTRLAFQARKPLHRPPEDRECLGFTEETVFRVLVCVLSLLVLLLAICGAALLHYF